jgi:hypothetical protein
LPFPVARRPCRRLSPGPSRAEHRWQQQVPLSRE